MAEGLLRHDAGDRFTVESAGTKPSSVRPEAIAVMKEVGIDITSHRSKHVDEFAGEDIDYVLTVCDNAKESCPVFFGKATRRHHSFKDPAAVEGSEEKRLGEFRRVRDEIEKNVREFLAMRFGLSVHPYADAKIIVDFLGGWAPYQCALAIARNHGLTPG